MLEFKDEKALVSFVANSKLPEWQVSLFKKNAEAVQVHSQGQLFYKINALFPNENPESQKHRVLSFESITEPSFGRAANNVNRIFKNSSYTCEASEKTIEIANGHTFEEQNFFNWFLDEWVKWALKEDPNSRIVVYPPEYVKKGNAQVVFVSSCHVRYMDADTVVFISEAESEVRHDLKETKVYSEKFYDQSINSWNSRQASENTFAPKVETTIVRPVYHAFFKGVGFYRIEQLKSTSGQEYDVEFFPWKADFLPVTDAGGEKSKNKVNKSFLSPFVPFGNLALLQHSQHTAVNFTFSFPRMSEIQSECDAEGCDKGRIECVHSDDLNKYPSGWKPCRACNGTGKRANQTPYKTYIKKYDPNGMEGDNKHLEVPEVQFYTPDTAILDYSKQEWKDYLEQAEEAVYIQKKVMTGNVEAAKSKEIDRDDLYSFLTRVAQVYFSKLRFCLQCFENYNVGKPMQVSVQIPYSFAILTEGEAFAALKDILASSVPIMIKASQVESFINKFVSQSSPIRKFVDVLKIVDPLLYYSNQEIMGFRLGNVITEEQYSNHIFSFPVLQQLYFEDNNLFLQDTKVIIKKVQEGLIAYKPPPPVDLKTKFLGPSA